MRLWSVDALTGTVAGELPAVSGSFSQRFGGGTADFQVPLAHLRTRDGMSVDWAAVQRVIGLVSGGNHTVVLTQGTSVVGEWLLMERPESIADGVIPIRGIEWDGYPALRSLHASYSYENTDQLSIARDLLLDAFQGWQPSFQITVPTQTSGVRRTASWRTREGYYSDALDEISLPEDGFDWRVEFTGEWAPDGSLTKVNRRVRFGSPVLSQSSTIVATHDGPGTRSGNCADFEQSIDVKKYLHSVYAWGAGDGAKKLFYEAGDNTWINQGFVKITKNLSYPDITNPSTLKALADAVLAAAQNIRNPATMTLLVDKLPTLPHLGDVIRAEIAPTYSIPTGYSGSMRVGEVSYTLEAGRADRVGVQAI